MGTNRRWRPDWAKGLTAETHPGLARMAAKKRGKPSWAKGLTASDHPGIARQAATRRGKKRGPYRSHGRPKDLGAIDPLTLVGPDQLGTYAYLLGLYLGDGSITHANRLEISLDSRQTEILDSCAEAMRALHPRGRANIRWKKKGINCKVVSSYAWQWLVLFPQHGPGRKHTRSIALAVWQEEIAKSYVIEFLRGLIESDGSRFSRWVGGKDYPAYSFTNRSADIRRIFCWAANLAGLHYTLPMADVISIARRADVGRLDSALPLKSPGR